MEVERRRVCPQNGEATQKEESHRRSSSDREPIDERRGHGLGAGDLAPNLEALDVNPVDACRASLRGKAIESVHELGFLERQENVAFLRPPIVGKKCAAIRLAITASRSGPRVYYGTLADRVTSLEQAQACGAVAS